MCEPITMAAIAAIGTAAQISATNQAMERQQAAEVEKQGIINKRIEEESADMKRETAAELTQKEREQMRYVAAQKVQMVESGAAGGSSIRNLGNVYMQGSFEKGSIIAKGEVDMSEQGRKSQDQFLSTRSKINELEANKTTGLAAALQIGASAATGYAAGGGFEAGSTFSGNVDKFKGTWGLG